jgi:precorrin-6A/cobalt-precorrin-6A reductase
MILLFGGTSETAPLATGIAGAGCAVLVTTATAVPLNTGNHPLITRRTGRLDETQMVELIGEKGVTAIVDAAHPYAVAVHETIGRVAARLALPCFVFRRPAELETERKEITPGSENDAGDAGRGYEIVFAENHEEAAALAFTKGRPVLLTTGSRNLPPYAAAARKSGISLAVRVLDAEESLASCSEAGIPAEMIIAGRGPFSVEDNLAAIKRFKIGTIVTKESGKAGGLDEKITAARLAQCRLIVIKRPPASPSDLVFDNFSALTAAVKRHCENNVLTR